MLMVLRTISIGTIALATAAASAQPPAVTPAPPAVWAVSDLHAPESAYYDAASDAVFVSSVNGQMTDKDGNGYISRFTSDGRIVNLKWATGFNGPKGLRSAGGTLWVADIDEVVGIEIATGRVTQRVTVEGASFLNDLATAADGTVYVSDSQGFRIYMVRDGTVSVFVEGEDAIETPNGVLVDGSRLIVGSIGRGAFGRRGGGPPPGGRLFAFDLRTRQRTVLTPDPIGGIDGIEPDGRGGYLVTDVFGSRILHVAASGATRTVLQLPAAGADFGYIAARRLAIVPYLFGNNLAAYDLSGALK